MTRASMVLALFAAAAERRSAERRPESGGVSPPTPRPTAPRARKSFHFRLGILGGLSMQKTDLELAAGYDFMKIGDKLRLAGDFTLGLRGPR